MNRIIKCALVMLLISFSTNAQEKIELKINPIGTIFGSPSLSGEYLITENFGAELTFNLITGRYGTVRTSINGFDTAPRRSGYGVMGMGKYYFSPDYGCDNFFAALYVRQRSWKVTDKDNIDYAGFERDILAVGFGIGYKWVGDQGIMLELAGGLGRTISETNRWIDPGNTGIAFPNLGIDGILRVAIGYRF